MMMTIITMTTTVAHCSQELRNQLMIAPQTQKLVIMIDMSVK